jgi:hypothetical protein
VLSLYLGATVLALAAAGLASRSEHRAALGAAATVAVVVCLGRWGGWPPLLDLVPPTWRVFRFPTKAFFTVHLAAALLAACGLDALVRQERRAVHVLVAAALLGAGVLALAPAVPALMPEGTAWFVTHFFPPGIPPPRAVLLLDHMLVDAAVGGALVLGLAVLGALVALGRLAGRPAAAAAAALVAADLLRAGAGLNAMVDRRFFETAPEVRRLVAEIRPVRLHACKPVATRAYWTGRAARPRQHEVFSFAVMRDSLVPHYNVGLHVATALGEDLTGLVPLERAPGTLGCGAIGALVPRLREAAVTHVASLDPLESPDLVPVAAPSPADIAPARVHFYALRDPLPRVSARAADGSPRAVRVASERSDEVRLALEPGPAAKVVLRDGYAVGWHASVDGAPAAIAAEDGRHRAVAVGADARAVRLWYRPPGLAAALWAAGLAAAAVAFLSVRGERR